MQKQQRASKELSLIHRNALDRIAPRATHGIFIKAANAKAAKAKAKVSEAKAGANAKAKAKVSAKAKAAKKMTDDINDEAIV